MINDFRHYALLVVVNFFDVGTIYFIICNLIMPRPNFLISQVENKHPPLSTKVIGMGIAYGVVFAYFSYLFQDSLIIFRITITLVFVVLIKLFTKDKLRNAMLIYSLAFLMIYAIQTPIGILLNLIDFLDIYKALTLVLCSFLITYVVYQKVALNKIFIFIKRSLQLFNVFILCSVTLFISVVGFYLFWKGDYAWIIISIIIAIAVVAIYPCIIYIMGLQLKIHNMNNLLEGIEYLLKTEEDKSEVYKHYDETLKSNGFKISKHETYMIGKHKENLIKFLNNKKAQHKSKAEFIIDIKFYYRHNKVPLSVMVQMLGTLLDNALETKTKKPIFIDMTVVGSQLEIIISNASDNKSSFEIDRMFGEGISAKKGEHGYGLPSLAKTVKRYDGEIIAGCNYNDTYKTHYLTLTLQFKNYD